jgi:hypothetical protein
VRGRRRPVAVGFELVGFNIDSGGESMGRRASAGEGRQRGGGSLQLHPSAGEGRTAARGVVATDRMGGGGSGGRWKTVGLIDGVGPPVSEGRRRADWAGNGGRRWAAAGQEKKRGGRAGTISWAEIK